MSPHEFESQLRAQAYGEITQVDKPVGYAMGEHRHEFDACALITAGEISITVAGTRCSYGVGDIFRLPAGTPHEESAQALGVSYLVGRRTTAS